MRFGCVFGIALFACLGCRTQTPEQLVLESIDAQGMTALYRSAPGKVLVVNFWATWCEPCIEEFPELVEVGSELGRRGLVLRFVSMDLPEEKNAVMEFLASQRVEGPSFLRSGKDDPFIRAAQSDWSGTLPATVVLDRDGALRNFWEGQITGQILREAVAPLLK